MIYLLRSAVEIVCCAKLLKLSVEISCCDVKVSNALKALAFSQSTRRLKAINGLKTLVISQSTRRLKAINVLINNPSAFTVNAPT